MPSYNLPIYRPLPHPSASPASSHARKRSSSHSPRAPLSPIQAPRTAHPQLSERLTRSPTRISPSKSTIRHARAQSEPPLPSRRHARSASLSSHPSAAYSTSPLRPSSPTPASPGLPPRPLSRRYSRPASMSLLSSRSPLQQHSIPSFSISHPSLPSSSSSFSRTSHPLHATLVEDLLLRTLERRLRDKLQGSKKTAVGERAGLGGLRAGREMWIWSAVRRVRVRESERRSEEVRRAGRVRFDETALAQRPGGAGEHARSRSIGHGYGHQRSQAPDSPRLLHQRSYSHSPSAPSKPLPSPTPPPALPLTLPLPPFSPGSALNDDEAPLDTLRSLINARRSRLFPLARASPEFVAEEAGKKRGSAGAMKRSMSDRGVLELNDGGGAGKKLALEVELPASPAPAFLRPLPASASTHVVPPSATPPPQLLVDRLLATTSPKLSSCYVSRRPAPPQPLSPSSPSERTSPSSRAAAPQSTSAFAPLPRRPERIASAVDLSCLSVAVAAGAAAGRPGMKRKRSGKGIQDWLKAGLAVAALG
ncbi:hypothetical protein JCM1841_000875 [Sporobolomyces salmonicolor]